jgi:hypothetical protein
MKTEMSQSELHKDQCTCRGCGVKSPVAVAIELKVNKWMCRNCGLIQLWVPSKQYLAHTASEQPYKPKLGTQLKLLFAGPFVGEGKDGCLTGIYANPLDLHAIIFVAFVLVVVRIVIEYYRQQAGEKKSYWKAQQKQKASNKVSGVDNWNRQRPTIGYEQSPKRCERLKERVF